MSNPVTLNDIFQLFERQKEETERRAAEWERTFAASKAESDRRAAEAKAEWERTFAASKAESDRRLAELDRVVKVTNEAVNNLTGRWGRFVEELVKPAVVEMFREKGIEIDHSFLRAEAPDRSMEIDILGVNTTDVVLVECKSRLTQEDVNYFLEKLPRFKAAFREFASYKIYGAVAGIEIDQGVDRYAYKKGLFVIKPSGNTVAIVNDHKFLPQTWE